ncbi:hypothetical protein H2198_000650 [Neophaeococcomyces mojaviensis]|uniref:Uncharacterized protein n=1 Tax=Neophaeococcomyces mojaviensis TaxID=3383035 RepID=A0ACC3AJJ2_9EURO|nr:hypothetical protein H2198_000650 [Knufia sp. JES_112]
MTEKPALPALASQFAVPKTSQHIVQSDGMSITLQCKLSYSARIPVYGSNPTSNVSEALFYIEKPILSMHEKRSLYDANGTLLFDIKERQSTFTTQCCIYVGGEETRVGNVGKSCNGYLLGQFGYGEKSFQDLLAVEKGSWWRGSVNLRHIKTGESLPNRFQAILQNEILQ